MNARGGRATQVLRVVLVAAVVSSIAHYGDNYLRFERYPPGFDGWITPALVWQAWVGFTAAGVLGYVMYQRDRWLGAAFWLAVYSVSGLISPLHYRYGAPSAFDPVQHVFIVTDGLTGVATLTFGAWLLRRGLRELRDEPDPQRHGAA